MYVKNFELTASFSNDQETEMYQTYIGIPQFKMNFWDVGVGTVGREMQCNVSIVADLFLYLINNL